MVLQIRTGLQFILILTCYSICLCLPASVEGKKMAKSLDDLKLEKATAKRLFSSLANGITRTYMEKSMAE